MTSDNASFSASADPGLSYAGPGVVSPGSLVDVYGQNLAGATATAAVPLPLNLAGAHVLVNGRVSPLVYASPTQIIFQVPYATAIGEGAVVVTVDGAPSAAAPMMVRQAAPSILTYGNNRAVVQHSDYSINSSANCAQQGSYVVVYLIGSGPLTNSIPTGAVTPAEPFAMSALPTTVTIGGTPAPVIFAGMTPGFVALMQVNFQIPSGAPGDLPLQVSIGGTQSNEALICVSR